MRRDADDECGLRLIDTSESLTLEELKELKKLASVSKATRVVLALIFAVVSITGLPHVVGWVSKVAGQ